MAKYRCPICGYIYDEEAEGKPLSELGTCKLCCISVDLFELVEGTPMSTAPAATAPASPAAPVASAEVTAPAPAAAPAPAPAPAPVSATAPAPAPVPAPTASLASAPAREKKGEKKMMPDMDFRHLRTIQALSKTGEPVIEAMATRLPLPSWDDILILGAQLNPFPLDERAPVNIETVIGKHATKPMVLAGPVYVSHVSFGALSREAKTAFARGSAAAKTAVCSGEGGILDDERDNAYKYIFEYVPNQYSVTDENLARADAIEIKFGQGTKPGMGGHLPGNKVTAEIAQCRGKKQGEDIISPSCYPDIHSPEDVKAKVDELRRRSGGRPIGIKIAAGHIEEDLDVAINAGCDFITIDGRGGATGASPKLVRDATSVPTLYALSRARAYLDERGSDIDLVITGGLRVSSDFVKAIALGADAVAVATAAMIAIGCKQFRVCGDGTCPMGIATQDPELRKNFNIEERSEGLANYLKATFRELETFCRITGHKDIHDLDLNDLVTTNPDIAEYCDIAHV